MKDPQSVGVDGVTSSGALGDRRRGCVNASGSVQESCDGIIPQHLFDILFVEEGLKKLVVFDAVMFQFRLE